ncbi:MAG: lipid-A-disaccharide synthase [Selenomonadaceae bacterium]|nr:lipid-A-disaccharide synthase [Selenomonadaceae bacterium]
MKIMLSAGEASGDLHGAQLAAEIKRQDPGIELVGFGGERMEEQGVRLWRKFQSYNIMGVLEVVMSLRRVWKLLDDLTDSMRGEKPDLLVIIDFPDFNSRLAKRARKMGIPVFSYIPPAAWAWRKGRAREYAAFANEIVPIFPFEAKPYEEAGANVNFLGNPLVDIVKTTQTKEEARSFFGIKEQDQVVLLLPGSRRQEIRRVFPVMLEAAELLLQKHPNMRFFLPVADGIDEAMLHEALAATEVQAELVHERRYDLMGLADAAMATSGTVLIEAALMDLPCVILYRTAALNYLIGRMLVHIEHIGLPNILLGRGAQTELLQDAAEPLRIAREVERLCPGDAHRAKVLEDLAEVRRRLGEPGATARIAAHIIALARQSEQ